MHRGCLYAYGPYGREVEIWADLFPRVVIAAPLRHETPPDDCVALQRSNISVAPQLETGGDSLWAKVIQIVLLPLHVWKLCLAMRHADAIHVRCPGNLGVLGVLLAPLFSKRIVAKYAGQWESERPLPLGFRLQQVILKSFWWRDGVVTVYGEWPNQPKQIVPFFTSMMTSDQVRRSIKVAAGKSLGGPTQFLYSGRLAPLKGVDLLLSALRLTIDSGVAAELTILGDGPERSHLEELSRELGLQPYVTFVGAVPYDDVMFWYERAHILVLASSSEGWPKVIAEAMCHGVVCIGTDTGLMPWMLHNRGRTFPEGDVGALAATMRELSNGPEQYLKLSTNAATWAQQYSLEGLRDALRTLLSQSWNIAIRCESHSPETAGTAAGAR